MGIGVLMEQMTEGRARFVDAKKPVSSPKMVIPVTSRAASIFAVFLALNLSATLGCRVLRPMSEVWFGTPHRFPNIGSLLCLLPLPLASAMMWLIVDRWRGHLVRGKRPWFPALSPWILGTICLLLLIPQGVDITCGIGKSSLYGLAGWICPPMPPGVTAGSSLGETLLSVLGAIAFFCLALAGNGWTFLRWCDQEPDRRGGLAWGSGLAIIASLFTIPVLPSLWKLRVVLAYTDSFGKSPYYMPRPGELALHGSGWRIDVFLPTPWHGLPGLPIVLMLVIIFPSVLAIVSYRMRARRNAAKATSGTSEVVADSATVRGQSDRLD